MNRMFGLSIAVLLTSIVATIVSAEDVVSKSPTTKLEFTKWSGDLNVPDPVAIAFDEHGRAYVTQTQRRKSQDLDIRQNRDWVPHDLSFQSVGDKRDFYHRELAIGDDLENAIHVDDMNQDGHHDYRDLMVLSEKVHLLEDQDGDGTADSMHEFAVAVPTEVTGIAAGVLHHAGKVYATIAPEVWQWEDTDNDGVADTQGILATGFGLHIAYAGHDMHGLTVGPDGKIYWSIGDKGISATSREGKEFHFPNQGGVMRCNPDGSDFEVFAHGLRNVQELAFDQYGNLFGVDNDADKQGERERFVYIVKGMDAGWRCNYQYRGKDYDPWMAEKLWQPWHEGQPAYIVPPISHSIDGPAGFAFNPGTALSPAYKDYFFLTGAPNGNQIAFQATPHGASFVMVNEHKIGSGIPLVGINFGPDGGLYGVDWGGGYPLNQSGAVWKIDTPTSKQSKEHTLVRSAVKGILATGAKRKVVHELSLMMTHADQRIRLMAQFELVDREALDTLSGLAKGDSELGRIHAVWGLGQLARLGNAPAQQHLVELLRDASTDAELRSQLLRTLGDLPDFDGRLFLPLLRNASKRVQFAAALALGDHPTAEAFLALVAFGELLKPEETYLRFALARGLMACGTPEQLQELESHDNPQIQLAAVVALRRKGSVAVEVFLDSKFGDVVNEAARAIHDDFSIPQAMPFLARQLNQTQHESHSLILRAINASFRIGGDAMVENVAKFAFDEAHPIDLRLEALAALRDWEHPSPMDRVTGRFREFKPDRKFEKSRLVATISALLLQDEPRIRSAALAVAIELGIPVNEPSLVSLVRSNDSVDVRLNAVDALVSQASNEIDSLLPMLLKSTKSELRLRAVALLAERKPTESIATLKQFLNSKELPERQMAVKLLGELGLGNADKMLLAQSSNWEDSAELKLELLEALHHRAIENSLIRTEVERLEKERIAKSATVPTALFEECLEGGDVSRGSRLFFTHIGAQCVRCHRIGKQGSDVGPALDGIAAKRDASHLLRAIVAPSHDIDEPYRTQVVLLDDGSSVQGVLAKRDPKSMTLLDAQGKEITIALNEIEEHFEQKLSLMPDMTKVLSRREIRDVVAYLQTLKRQ